MIKSLRILVTLRRIWRCVASVLRRLGRWFSSPFCILRNLCRLSRRRVCRRLIAKRRERVLDDVRIVESFHYNDTGERITDKYITIRGQRWFHFVPAEEMVSFLDFPEGSELYALSEIRQKYYHYNRHSLLRKK